MTRSFKKINWLKAGIISADKVVTVSPNYATEVRAAEELGAAERGGGGKLNPGSLGACTLPLAPTRLTPPSLPPQIMSGEDKGVELHDFLAARDVEGIVNGMDVEEWDPAADKLLTVKYDRTNVVAGKAAAKEQLQAECGLPVDPAAPVFSFIGR